MAAAGATLRSPVIGRRLPPFPVQSVSLQQPPGIEQRVIDQMLRELTTVLPASQQAGAARNELTESGRPVPPPPRAIPGRKNSAPSSSTNGSEIAEGGRSGSPHGSFVLVTEGRSSSPRGSVSGETPAERWERKYNTERQRRKELEEKFNRLMRTNKKEKERLETLEGRELHRLSPEQLLELEKEVTAALERIRVCRLKLQAAEERKCRICFDRPSDHVFAPCGHAMICGACAARCKACPFCNQPIQSVIRFFLE